MRWLAVLVLVAGCDKLFSLSPVDDVTVDASTDSGGGPDGVVGIDAALPLCLGEHNTGNLCPTQFDGDITLAAGTIDTDADSRCETIVQSGGPPLCVIAARSIRITGTVVAKGAKPIVFFAQDSLVIDAGAAIDVSSRNGTILTRREGAGANAAACGVANGGTNQPTAGMGGAGGGHGGSFGGRGGAGGVSSEGTVVNAPLASVPTNVRGGCRGSRGGGNPIGEFFGASGASGGATWLLAGSVIVIDGSIYGWGAGGGGATSGDFGDGAGGGGGGSGGLIGIEAPTVRLASTAMLLAQGGGGGGGSSELVSGGDGLEQSPSAPQFGAPGGSGPNNAGDGGDGPNAATLDGVAGGPAASMNTGGAGGGGGGAGHILIYAGTKELDGAIVYPPATP